MNDNPSVERHHSEQGTSDVQSLVKIAKTLRDKDIVAVDNLGDTRIKNYKTFNDSDSKNYDHFVPTEEEEKVYNQVTRDLTIAEQNYNTPLSILGYRTYAEAMPYFQRLYLATMYRSRMNCNDSKQDIIAKEIMTKGDIFIAYTNSRILYPSYEVQGVVSDQELINFAVNNASEAICRDTNYEDFIRQANTALVYSPMVVVSKNYDYIYIHDGNEKYLDWKTSGHSHEVVDLREMYFADLREEDMQKQPFIIRKRYIEETVAKDLYGDHKNWKYVKQGYKQTFNFNRTTNEYELNFINDPNSSFNLVELIEVDYRFKNRRYAFVNNILVTGTENKMKRADGLYSYEVYRHKTIQGNLVGVCIAQDLEQEETYQSFFKTVLRDMALYQIKPPLLSIGKQALSKDIWQVGSINHSTDPNTKVIPLIPPSDLNAAITLISQSKNDGQRIISDQLGGQPLGTKRTATEVRALEGNLNTFSNEWLATNKLFVRKYGDLLLGDILEHDLSVKIDEDTNEIITRDIVNRDSVVNGSITDVVVRPVNPLKKMSIKYKTKKLKDSGKFEYLPEIETLLDLKDEELKSEMSGKPKTIILFDISEIKTIQFKTLCDVQYLVNKDKIAQSAEVQDFVNTWAASGVLNVAQIAREQAIQKFGNKGKDYILEPQAPAQTQPESNTTQVDQNQLIQELQANL